MTGDGESKLLTQRLKPRVKTKTRDERTGDICVRTLFSGARIGPTRCDNSSQSQDSDVSKKKKNTLSLSPGFVKNTQSCAHLCNHRSCWQSREKGTVAWRKGRCPQMELSLCLSASLSLFLCHRWTQSHLFLSHMPYSYIISVSVGARLTCLFSHKMGCLRSESLNTHTSEHAFSLQLSARCFAAWSCGRYNVETLDSCKSV